MGKLFRQAIDKEAGSSRPPNQFKANPTEVGSETVCIRRCWQCPSNTQGIILLRVTPFGSRYCWTACTACYGGIRGGSPGAASSCRWCGRELVVVQGPREGT